MTVVNLSGGLLSVHRPQRHAKVCGRVLRGG